MKIEIKCKVCNKIFYLWPSMKRKANYCSRKCYHESKKGVIPWNKGKKGFQVAWNKGKKGTCHITEEGKKKISLIHKGKKLSKETKHKISEAHKGEKNYNWKGGRFKTDTGYIFISKYGHPFPCYIHYVLEHRLVMEKHLDRYLNSKEVVHHINGIRDDNRLENLQLFKNDSEHMKFHFPKGSLFGANKHLKFTEL